MGGGRGGEYSEQSSFTVAAVQQQHSEAMGTGLLSIFLTHSETIHNSSKHFSQKLIRNLFCGG